MREPTSVRLEQMMPLIRERLAAGETVQFTPHGTSMRPMLEGGRDQVELSAAPERLRPFDLPLYQRANGQYVLHRIVRAEAAYTCIGDNQFEEEYPVNHDQILAVVTGFTRKGRHWSVEDAAYQRYCRLWHGTRPARYLWRRAVGKVRGGLSRIKRRIFKGK